MKAKFVIAAFAALLLSPCAVVAQAPAGATGKCKDGTYTTSATKSGACRGHKGIDTWLASTSSSESSTATGGNPAAPAKSTTTSTSTPAGAPAAEPAASSTSSSSSKSSSSKSSAPKTVAPGGGPGLVWVNTSSNVYHCYGSADYGTTKQGKYMSEADAKAAGARASRNQACSK